MCLCNNNVVVIVYYSLYVFRSPSPVSPDSSSKKFGKKMFPWQPWQRSSSTGHSPPSPGKEELHLIPAATQVWSQNPFTNLYIYKCLKMNFSSGKVIAL